MLLYVDIWCNTQNHFSPAHSNEHRIREILKRYTFFAAYQSS